MPSLTSMCLSTRILSRASLSPPLFPDAGSALCASLSSCVRASSEKERERTRASSVKNQSALVSPLKQA